MNLSSSAHSSFHSNIEISFSMNLAISLFVIGLFSVSQACHSVCSWVLGNGIPVDNDFQYLCTAHRNAQNQYFCPDRRGMVADWGKIRPQTLEWGECADRWPKRCRAFADEACHLNTSCPLRWHSQLWLYRTKIPRASLLCCRLVGTLCQQRLQIHVLLR